MNVVRSNSQDMPVQERFFERMVEKSLDNRVHWSEKEFVLELPFEVCKLSSQYRISQRTVEQIEVLVVKIVPQGQGCKAVSQHLF